MKKLMCVMFVLTVCAAYSVWADGNIAADTTPMVEDTATIDAVDTTQQGGEVDTMVTIKTSKGDIKLKLYDEEAPITVENFLKYANDGHYNGTIFHRVIGNFMVQGGGFTPDMVQKTTRAPIKNEADNGKHNKRGTVAMARTQVIDSATSQFFINVVDNGFLDYRDPSIQGYGYCVFGEVVDGMDVVDEIRNVKTGRHGHFSDVPVEPIEILEVTVDE